MNDAYARHTDPGTSHEAAAKVDTTRLEALVVECLSKSPVAMNTLEISAWLGIDKWSITPRMKPLEEKGKIVCVGAFETERAGRKRRMRHYVIKPEAVTNG